MLGLGFFNSVNGEVSKGNVKNGGDLPLRPHGTQRHASDL